ncbi:hypothetical protein [Nostocoides australiense]
MARTGLTAEYAALVATVDGLIAEEWKAPTDCTAGPCSTCSPTSPARPHVRLTGPGEGSGPAEAGARHTPPPQVDLQLGRREVLACDGAALGICRVAACLAARA